MALTEETLNGLIASNNTGITIYKNMATSGTNYNAQLSDIGEGNLLFTLTYQTA